MRRRNVVAAILQRCTHPVAALAHRRIRQPHGAELFLVELYLREVDLNVDQVSIDSINGSTAGLEKH